MTRVLSSLLLFLLIFWTANTQAAPSANVLLQAAEESKEADSTDGKQAEDEKPAEDAKADDDKAAAKSEDDKKSDEAEEDEEADDDEDGDKDEDDEDDDEDEADDEEDDDDADDDDEDDEDDNEKSKSDKGDKKKSDDKPKPHKVERKPIKIEAEIDVTFVAQEMQEVALRPETWSQFKVVEAVEHGVQVKKGDVLVRFDAEKIEKEIEEQSLTQRLSELSLMQQEEEFPRIKRLMEIKFESAKTRYAQFQEDYKYYQEVDRPFDVTISHFLYNRAKEDLASQQEELEQLLKMYEADEITEETEAIVLRRQRFAVETEELMLDIQEASRDYSLEVSIPRRDERNAKAMEEAELSFEQSKTAKEKGLTRLTYEMQQKRDARADSIERHAKLISDQGLMIIRAPADGTVYYGRCIKGKWAEVTTYSSKLKPFGIVTANKVLMTIVEPGPLCLEASIAEKDRPDFSSGLVATVSPTGDDEVELAGKVTKVANIQGGDKKFAVHLDVDTEGAPEWLVAGMTGKAKVVTYENKEAIVVPEDMVQTDKDNDKLKYVMLVEDEDEEPVRREVKLGKTKDKLVEVLKGLDEGDEIVKEEKKKEED